MIKTFTIENNNNHIAMIDYLKGFSIFTIVFMHLIQNYIKAIPHSVSIMSSIGGSGVHVFFLCSGTGLYMSYMKHKVGFIEFIKKRLVKIYTPYIIVVIVSFFIPWLYNGNDRAIALLSHIFLFKMFIPKYESSFGIQLWFVSTIVQLYLLFIPMCRIKKKIKNQKLFFSIFLAISLIWWIIVWFTGMSDERVWNSFCLQYIWEFALGMCLAEFFTSGRKLEIKNYALIIAAVLGVSLQVVMALFSDELKVFNDIPALIGYISLAIVLCSFTVLREGGNRLSSFSYELYLVHILVIDTVFHYVSPAQLMGQAVVGIFSLILCMLVSYGYNLSIRKVFRINS